MFISIKFGRRAVIVISLILTALIICFILISVKEPKETDDGQLRVLIVTYHSISADEDMLSGNTVSPQIFESDLLYLRSKGYEPVFVNELIMHVRYGYELPKKPVIITIDDGRLNALTRALEICKRQGFKLTVACVGKQSETAAEGAQPDEDISYCDALDIKLLRESGLCEIACQSYDMNSVEDRKGILQKPGESEEQYASLLLRDISRAQRFFEDKCGFRPNVYCYPFGLYDGLSSKLVRAGGFEASLSCDEGINVITDEQSLYGLKRFERRYGESSEEFFKKIFDRY